MREEWKKYADTEYEISNLARVRSYNPKMKYSDADGYVYPKIGKNGNQVRFMAITIDKATGKQRIDSRGLAKAVYETFTGDMTTNMRNPIIYIDGDMENCRLDNLLTMNKLLEIAKENGLIK